jgi:hypothetical protein
MLYRLDTSQYIGRYDFCYLTEGSPAGLHDQ